MNTIRFARLSLLPILIGAGAVHAQCQPGWDSRYKSEGLVSASPLAVRSLLVHDDDGTGPALFVAGRFELIGGSFSQSIARFDGKKFLPLGAGARSDIGTYAGVLDTTRWDPDGPGPQGPALVCAMDTAPGVQLWSNQTWTPQSLGLLPSSFDGYITVNAVQVFNDGAGGGSGADKLFAAGRFEVLNGSSNLAVWDGSRWRSIGANGANNAVYDLEVHNDGSGDALYAAGSFLTIYNRPNTRLIAKWNGADWSAVAGGIPADRLSIRKLISFDPDASGPAAAELFAFGITERAGWETIPNQVQVWRLSAGTWTSVFTAQSEYPPAAAVFDDGSGPGLYMVHNSDGDPLLHRWNGSSFTPIPTTPDPALRKVATLGVFDAGFGPHLLAGGSTLRMYHAGQWRSLEPTRAPRVRSPFLFDRDGAGPAAPWVFTVGNLPDDPGATGPLVAFDGQAWFGVGGTPPPGGISRILASRTDTQPPELYGSMSPPSSIGGVWRWADGQWNTVGSGFDHYVRYLEVAAAPGQPTELYAAGEFNNVGNQPAARVARWNGSQWRPVGDGANTPYVPLADASIVGSFIRFGTDLFIWEFVPTLDPNALDASRVQRFDGTNWVDADPGTWAVFTAFNNELYAFSGLGVLRWNGTTWDPFVAYPPETGLIMSVGAADFGQGTRLFMQLADPNLNEDYYLLGIVGRLISLDPESGWQAQPDMGLCFPITNVVRRDGPGANGNLNVFIESEYADLRPADAAPPYYSFSGLRASGLARWGTDQGPEIFTQPIPRTASAGAEVKFLCDARGVEPLTYQWRRNGTPVNNGPAGASIGGGTLFRADSALLVIANVAVSDAGAYDCLVTDACGNVTSSAAVLTITSACAADFNHDNSVSVLDVLTFLSEWFARTDAADIDRSGVVNLQDLFGYLTLFFQGCP